MPPMQFNRQWILVTGASSGLGLEMARQLAREHKANLVLVARREDRLHALAQELESSFGVQARVIASDLQQAGAARELFERATETGPLYGAILNAGVTHFGDWDEQSWEGFERMQAVNVTSVVELSRLLLPHFEEQRTQGGLMLVSSMAGLTPTAYQTAYSATKAFLVHFGCGLHHEMKSRGVSVTTFCPGGIDTEMTSGARFNELRGWLMPVEKCAAEALKSYRARQYVGAPGFFNKVSNLVSRLAPQRLLHGQIAVQYRRSLQRNR